MSKSEQQEVNRQFTSYLNLLNSPTRLSSTPTSARTVSKISRESLIRIGDLVTPTMPGSNKRFQCLVQNVCQQRIPTNCLRLLCAIHSCLQMHNYATDMVLEVEQSMELPSQFSCQNKIEQWISSEVVPAYSRYISRICANAPMYSRVKDSVNSASSLASKLTSNNSESSTSPMIEMFLVINQMNVFVHLAKQIFNSLGRYYQANLNGLDSLFYNTLKQEFLQLYQYLGSLVSTVVRDYDNFSAQQLQCFLEGTNQIDRINDSMEEFVKNKYYSKNNSMTPVVVSQDSEDLIIAKILNQNSELTTALEHSKILI